MASETQRRGILYTSAIVLAAALIFLGFGITVAPDIGTRIGGASMLAGAGAFDKALDEIDLGIREHPDALDAYVCRAGVLGMAQRYDEAIDAYDTALAHEDATGEMRRSLQQDRASVLLRAGRTNEFQAARAELAQGGIDHFVHMVDALAAADKKQWGESVKHFRAAYDEEPTPATKGYLWDVLLHQGRDAIAAGRTKEAERCFREAGKLFPNEAQAFLKGGEVRLAEGDTKGALTILGACPDDAPGLAPLLFRCATALLAEDRTAAIDVLDRAIMADRESVLTLLETERVWADLVGHERNRVEVLIRISDPAYSPCGTSDKN